MLLPQAERVEVQSDFFHEERFTFDFPVDRFHFVDRNKVQSHSLLDGNNMLEDELPTVPEDVGTTLHPTRFLYSPILRQFLVFSELYDTIALNKDEGTAHTAHTAHTTTYIRSHTHTTRPHTHAHTTRHTHTSVD
jgi:hypothetical protein